MRKKYFIKEVANAVGLSIEGVKYYEAKNLVEPIRIDNGYRVYSHADIARLSTFKMLGSLGLSNKGIYDYIYKNDNIDKSNLLVELQQKLEHEITMKKLSLEKLKILNDKIYNLDKYYNQFKIVERDKTVIIDFKDDKKIKDNIDKQNLIKLMYENMPLVDNITFITLPISKNLNPSLGFRLDYDSFIDLKIETTENIKIKNPGKYLNTIQKIPRHQKNFPFEKNILNYANENNLTLIYPMEITFLTTKIENGEMYDYYEYMIELK